MRTCLCLLVCGVIAAAPAGDQALRSRILEAWFAAGPLPDLEARTHSSFEVEPGIVAERVSYATQYGMRVPAIVYRPKAPAAPAPGIIVVNGHGGDKYSWYAQYSGVLYARAGAFVLTYDPTGEGERNAERQSGTRSHDVVERLPELGQRLGGLMMTDIRQAVSYLSGRPEVDAKRLAAFGYSMGSFILGVTCAVETRLKSCVLVGGGNFDGPNGYWDNSKPMCQGYPYQALTFLGDRPEAIYALHASRGSTLLYNGLEDTTVAIPRFGESYFRELQTRVAKRRGTPAGVFDAMFFPGAGHRPYFVTKAVALWLERQLAFPNWTSAGVEAMPVTHIAEWAHAHAVELDKLYATEHREGGTRALGSGVPGIRREQLHVYSDEEWRGLRDRLTHEHWRERARQAVAEKRR